MRGLMMDSSLNLSTLLRHTERIHGAREVCARAADRTIRRTTYAGVLQQGRRLGEALRALGLQRGDRVATLCWNHDRHLAAYYGVPTAGFVLHTLNLRLHPTELAYIVTHAGDRAIIVDASLYPLFEQFRRDTKIEHVIVVTDDGDAPPGTHDYDRLVAAHEPAPYVDVDERDAGVMCYTSGTTGKPKGVLYSHRALVLHTFAVVAPDVFGIGASDTVLPVVPMFHANAWGVPFATAYTGSKLVLPGPHLDAASIVDLLERERVTFTAGVPTIWVGILQHLDTHPGAHDLSAIRRMVIGGAAAPLALVRGFAERHGLTVIQGWGMTETTPVGSVTGDRAELLDASDEERWAYRATQGRPVPYVEIRARGDDGLVPMDGQTMGELEVRGPWVAAAYFADDESADKFTADGWFRTGDIVTLGPTGQIRIQDRSKDLVKSGGEWISSVQLETHLMGHPDVLEAAVVAIAHPRWTERPLACVVLRPGHALDVASLREHVLAHFARWWLPDDFVVVDSLPRTGTGKVKKTDLRARFADHYANAAPAVENVAVTSS